jgi:hypothetical protein
VQVLAEEDFTTGMLSGGQNQGIVTRRVVLMMKLQSGEEECGDEWTAKRGRKTVLRYSSAKE